MTIERTHDSASPPPGAGFHLPDSFADLEPRGQLNRYQYWQLLQPVDPIRVHKTDLDGRVVFNLAQQDVRAHLSRIFGFDKWETHLIGRPTIDHAVSNAAPGEPVTPGTWWSLTCSAAIRLTVFDTRGRKCGEWEEEGVHTGVGSYGAALRTAKLGAVSVALKRAASCLGDQFGLSLYNRGQMSALVGWILPGVIRELFPGQEGDPDDAKDIQTGLPEQVSDDDESLGYGADPVGNPDMGAEARQAAYAEHQLQAATGAAGPAGEPAGAELDDPERLRVLLLAELEAVAALDPVMATALGKRIPALFPGGASTADPALLAPVVQQLRSPMATAVAATVSPQSADLYRSASAQGMLGDPEALFGTRIAAGVPHPPRVLPGEEHCIQCDYGVGAKHHVEPWW